MAEKQQYELPDNPSGIMSTGGRMNLNNLSDAPTPGQVSYANIPTIQSPIGEFTKELLPGLTQHAAALAKAQAKKEEEESKAGVVRRFAKTMKDMRDDPKIQEMNPAERDFQMKQVTLDYIANNLQYADSLAHIKTIAEEGRTFASDQFSKMEEGGLFALDAHGNAKFFAKDRQVFLQQATARAVTSIAPSIVAAIGERYRDDPEGAQKELMDEVHRQATLDHTLDAAKMMKAKEELVNADNNLSYNTLRKTTVPIIINDWKNSINKSLKVMKDSLASGVPEEVALGKFKESFTHITENPDIQEIYLSVGKADEYNKLVDSFKGYLDIAATDAKGLDKKNRLQYDETTTAAKKHIEDLNLELGIPAGLRYAIEKGQNLYSFGLTMQLVKQVPDLMPTNVLGIMQTVVSGDPKQEEAMRIMKAANAGDLKSYKKLLGYTINAMTNALGGYQDGKLPQVDANKIYNYASAIQNNKKLFTKLSPQERVQFQSAFEQVKAGLTPNQVKLLDARYAGSNSVIPAPPAPGEN